MRNAFLSTLVTLAAEDTNIWLLCGDLGYAVLEPFIGAYPDRFVNVGVAEQNMMGVAAGLALSGKTVFVYSIANFPTLRCYEQIRNDVCYHKANVKIVAVGGGLAYGPLGYTHHGAEDLAVMRVLPYMTVIAPGDPFETREATQAIASLKGPAYLRLAKAGEPILHKSPIQFKIGQAIEAVSGNDVTLISTGTLLETALEVSKRLKTDFNIQARVISMHTLVPFDKEIVLKAAQETRVVFTLEEHGLGGLASTVAEVLAQYPKPLAQQIPLHLPVVPFVKIGSQEALRDQAGLSAEKILSKILASL